MSTNTTYVTHSASLAATWILQLEVHWEADKEGEVDLDNLKSLLISVEHMSALLYLIHLHVAFKMQIIFSASEMKASVISKSLFE